MNSPSHHPDSRLDSLRRVAQRLREIADDPFAAGLAARLEEELIRRGSEPVSASADTSRPTTPTN